MVEDLVPFGNCRQAQQRFDALRLHPEPRLEWRSLGIGAFVNDYIATGLIVGL